MVAFTIFFCGTGSNSFDFAHSNYHRGELVSTLARNHAGQEFVDWIIVDGPGSGNLQEPEKWVPSGNYSQTRGQLQGAGWEENVAHAIAVLKGSTTEGRTTHTSKEEKRLRAAGVGVREEPGRVFGDYWKRTVHDPLHRINPQELQKKRIEILGRNKVFDRVNVIGWSRGGVTCHMFANAMASDPELAHLPINIFACDPVPGQGQFDTHRIDIRGNVQNYVAIYAADERSRGFSPVLPSLPRGARKFITTIPGRHATLVGNASLDGDAGAGVDGINGVAGPGRVTRDLAERFLASWGTTLSNRLNLADTDVLRLYDEMIGQGALFEAMHDISYTYFTQKGARPVGLGNGTFADFSQVRVLVPDPHFVNIHHRAVFAGRYTRLYGALFEGVPVDRGRMDLEVFNLKMMYPKLYRKWKRLGLVD